jgi:hypothetical protein
MANPILIDGRNTLDAAAVTAAGITYEGVGRPQLTSATAASLGETAAATPTV